MHFFVAVAWRNLWRHKRRSLITAVAMAFGVGLCMVTVAFNDGMFEDMFEVMVEQQLGHLQVHHPAYPSKRVLDDTLKGGEALLAAIDAHPDTAAASPRLHGFVLVGGEKKSAGALLVGIVPERERQVTPLADRVQQGTFLTGPGQILVGHKLLEEIEVSLGDEVVVVTQAADGSLGNALFTVAGTYKSGNVQMDRAGAYLGLDELQDLLVLPDQLHGVTVLADDPAALDAYATDLRARVGTDEVSVETWWEASPQTAQLMGMRDASAIIVLGIVFGAAAFGILNTMMMSVFERTRELGVLRALGIRPGHLVLLVVVESVFLAALASSIGLVIGGVLDGYLVVYGLDMSTAAEDGFSFQGVMLDPVIHGVVRWQSVLLVIGSVFLVSVGASLYPAFRAARLRPVEAIRSE